MSFWENETCERCGGQIVERRVTLHRKTKGGYVMIENVPVGVCRECGTRYYTANVLNEPAAVACGGEKTINGDELSKKSEVMV